MNITFEGKYKSIENFKWENIPKFVVITGKNGTGKSQLLNIIDAGITKSWKDTPNVPAQFPIIQNEIYRIEHLIFLKGEWSLSNIGAIGINDIQVEREQLYNKFIERSNVSKGKDSESFKGFRENWRKHHSHIYINEFFDDIIEKNSLFNGKTLSKDEFLNVLPNNPLIDLKQQATNINIGKIFYNYRLDLFQAKADGISEKEFITKNSEKPWIIINHLFKEIDLPFELNNPEEVSIRDMYTPILKNIESNNPINFSELSSGEKVLVSLIFWLFN